MSIVVKTRGPKGHISCTWVQCATFLTDLPWRPSLNSVQRFQRRSRKCLSQSKGGVAILFFRSARKNTNLVEDVEILLPVNFVDFRQAISEKSKMSQPIRGGWPSCFSDRSQKHKLGRGRWDIASCLVSLNSIQWFQRRSRKCEKLTMSLYSFVEWLEQVQATT